MSILRVSRFVRLAVCFVLLLGSVGYFVAGAEAQTTTYYVDATGGNDANTGTSTGQAWQTLAKVNGTTFQPGDTILFKKGELWREQLVVPSSGVSGNPITFDSYGSGSAPKFTSTDVITGSVSDWTDEGSDKWSLPLTYQARIVLFNSTELGVRDAAVDDPYDWFWAANTLTVYATENPATHFSKIEAGQRSAVITLNGKDYVTVKNLELYGGQITPGGGNGAIQGGVYIPEESVGVTISGLNIHQMHGTGILVRGGNEITLSGNTIADVVGEGLGNFGDGVTIRGYASLAPSQNISITGNTISAQIERHGVAIIGATNSSVSGNTITNTDGGPIDLEGNGSDTITNITVSGNTINNQVGYGIVADGSKGTMSSISITDNDINMNDVLSAQGIDINTSAGTNIISDNTLTGVYNGIEVGNDMTADVLRNKIIHGATNPNVGILIRDGAGGTVAYNQIVDSVRAIAVNVTTAPVYIYNNVLYNYTSTGIYADSPFTLKNNIFSTLDSSVIHVSSSVAVTSDYNLFYAPNDSVGVFDLNSTYYDSLSEWQVGEGYDTHSLEEDPLFTNAGSNNFTLQAGSPAIDAGIDLGTSWADTLVSSDLTPPIATVKQGLYGLGWEMGAYIFDSLAPETSVTALTNNATSLHQPTITGQVVDGVTSISGVEYQVDGTGGSWTACTAQDGSFNSSSEQYSCAVAGTLGNGLHTLYVRSTDANGNTTQTGSATSYIFTVDGVAPVVSLSSAPTASLTTASYHATGTVTDSVGVIQSVEYALDSASGTWSACTAQDGNFNSDSEGFDCAVESLGDGAHTIYVRARDAALSYSETKSLALVVQVPVDAGVADDGPELAVTGDSTVPYVVGVLLALGGLFYASRRKLF